MRTRRPRHPRGFFWAGLVATSVISALWFCAFLMPTPGTFHAWVRTFLPAPTWEEGGRYFGEAILRNPPSSKAPSLCEVRYFTRGKSAHEVRWVLGNGALEIGGRVVQLATSQVRLTGLEYHEPSPEELAIIHESTDSFQKFTVRCAPADTPVFVDACISKGTHELVACDGSRGAFSLAKNDRVITLAFPEGPGVPARDARRRALTEALVYQATMALLLVGLLQLIVSPRGSTLRALEARFAPRNTGRSATDLLKGAVRQHEVLEGITYAVSAFAAVTLQHRHPIGAVIGALFAATTVGCLRWLAVLRLARWRGWKSTRLASTPPGDAFVTGTIAADSKDIGTDVEGAPVTFARVLIWMADSTGKHRRDSLFRDNRTPHEIIFEDGTGRAVIDVPKGQPTTVFGDTDRDAFDLLGRNRSKPWGAVAHLMTPHPKIRYAAREETLSRGEPIVVMGRATTVSGRLTLSGTSENPLFLFAGTEAELRSKLGWQLARGTASALVWTVTAAAGLVGLLRFAY